MLVFIAIETLSGAFEKIHETTPRFSTNTFLRDQRDPRDPLI